MTDQTDPAAGQESPVLTQAQQAALSPQAVLAELVQGNAAFVAGPLTVRDHHAQLPYAEAGQFPKAIVLSCVDSRVPVEMVFDAGIGDLFVARVAGNCSNADILGSMEYACHVAGSKLIVVLGHQHCGAVGSAIEGVELGNITELLSKIMPAVEATATDGERTKANASFVAEVTAANVRHTMSRIRQDSALLADMETDGKIAIVGGVYSLATGQVEFLDD